MTQMHPPSAGGATAFVGCNVSVILNKGDVLFWYNMLPNGDFDYRTRHAGCPVLDGEKWISNSWIHEYSQV